MKLRSVFLLALVGCSSGICFRHYCLWWLWRHWARCWLRQGIRVSWQGSQCVVRTNSTLWCILLCFDTISGLRINLAKSEIVPIGEVEEVEYFWLISLDVELLHCQWNIWVCRWVLHIRPLLFGIELLRKCNISWLDGRNFIWLRVIGWLCLKVLSPIYLRITCRCSLF